MKSRSEREKTRERKSWICFAICAVFLSTLTVCPGAEPVYGNSAPSYWEAFPYSDVLAVEENSPITVDREQLTFDFSETWNHDDYWSPVGRILAQYRMTNPTDDTLSVQMAFPFVASLSKLSVPDIKVSADSAAVPYEIYIDPKEAYEYGGSSGGLQYGYGTIGDISNQEWALPGFDLDSKAKLYRYAVSAGTEDRLDFEISYDADPARTILMGTGFSGVSYSEEGSEKLTSAIREKAEPEILVLGKDLDFTYDVLTKEGEKVDKNLYQLEIIEESVDPKEYLLSAIRKNLAKETAAAISDTQFLNLCLHEIWRESQAGGYSELFDVLPTAFSDRIFTLVYQVEFSPESARNVSVSYITEGTMDRRETLSPKYGYTYLLSPAKSWADFGSLDIEIITPQEAPYIVESSLALAKDGANRYTAQFEGLPESELTFTLYEKEAVTFVDRAKKTASESLYNLAFFWPVSAILLAIIALIVVRSVVRRMRNNPGG